MVPVNDDDELIEMAVCLIENMRWQNDAYVKAKQQPENDELYRTAHMLAEGGETIKRCFVDEIIDLFPIHAERLRAVCPHPAYTSTKGSIRVNKS